MMLSHVVGESLPSRDLVVRRREGSRTIVCGLALSAVYLCVLHGCNDVSKAPPLDPGPGALTITTAALPNAVVSQPYATTVSGSGGITPYHCSVTPALPPNLSFDQSTGAITGTPSAQGTSSHTFTLTDSSSPSQTVQKVLTLTITSAPAVLTITTTSLP